MSPQSAALLGVSPARATPMFMLDAVTAGFPVAALDRVAATMAPGDANFRYRVVAKTTLNRRRKQQDERLSTEESEKLVRLADVWEQAFDIWKDADEARGFLAQPHMALNMRKPIDLVLQAEIGAQMVKDLLGRIKHGTGV